MEGEAQNIKRFTKVYILAQIVGECKAIEGKYKATWHCGNESAPLNCTSWNIVGERKPQEVNAKHINSIARGNLYAMR